MADPVEHTAWPPPDRRRGQLEVDDAVPGAGGPLEDAAVPTRDGQQPSQRGNVLRPGDPGGQGPESPSPRAPDWYRRSVIVAVVAALAVPATHGALWFTGPGAASPPGGVSASRPVPTPAPGTGGQQQSGDAAPPSSAQVAELLGQRARAVVDRDRAAWLATVDPAVPGLAAAQGELFDRLATVRPSSWRYELLTPDATLTDAERAALPAGAVLERVRLSYRLAPTAPEVTHEQHLTLVRRDRWLVAGAHAGPQQSDPWDLGPVAVARGRRSVVVAAGRSPVPAARTAGEADAAAARVDAVWGKDWSRTVVVLVPSDVEQMAALLGRSSTAGLDQLAAVTTGESGAGSSSRTTGDRVVLNPRGFAELTATGRGAVLAHELTHVATRATVRSTPPLWVDEGFADYVAYLGTSLRPRDLAADLLDSRRALASLRDLPSDAEFDPAAARVGAAYAKAWLAMRFVAQQGGTAQVVDFYRVATGLPALRRWPRGTIPRASLAPKTPLERACVEVLGYVEPSFVRRWVVYVRAVAAGR